MKDVIAKFDLICERASGERFSVIAEIGRPYDISAREAACPVAIRGLHESHPDVHGSDSFQALMLAIGLVHRLLTDFVQKGGRVYFYDGKHEFDFAPYFRAWRT